VFVFLLLSHLMFLYKCKMKIVSVGNSAGYQSTVLVFISNMTVVPVAILARPLTATYSLTRGFCSSCVCTLQPNFTSSSKSTERLHCTLSLLLAFNKNFNRWCINVITNFVK
jgi:hypothetical protein